MNRKTTPKSILRGGMIAGLLFAGHVAMASSHREAPLISMDPMADNTDVYAFRAPDDTTKVCIITNFVPFQLPEGGPNWYPFGDGVRYMVHIKNDATTAGDDITYRFTFTRTNEDPTTHFNIRLGARNLHQTYQCEKSTNNGSTWTTIITSGDVPPPNIGPRSIETSVGLDTTYQELEQNAIATATSGEDVFCGPRDDPFFVDLAGAFDLGNFRPEGNSQNPTKDGLARYNVNTIALKIPISMLQKNGMPVTSATSILDPNYVIGVWASTERQMMRTIAANGQVSNSGSWIQVSRLGMPLTNEAIIPIGMKDRWNGANPANDVTYAKYFTNPELALYMDDSKFGTAVPALNALRIQSNSRADLLPAYPNGFDFRNGRKGLYALKGSPLLNGTALDDALYGTILLPDSASPRSVDILPIFFTGVPNLAPYQLATGKAMGNPLAAGKPFINNFLATRSDMLRLNMAVPVTQRNDPNFSSLGIVAAAVAGLTNPTYNANASLQFIPNMDGFPNGRRLEDDVTTIELQAVSGVVLAAIGLWYNDYHGGTQSPVTPQLLSILTYNAGPTHNDTTNKASFPYVQIPWRGFDYSYQERF